MANDKLKSLGYKELLCINADPETSKYWKVAPKGGCNEVVRVDINTSKVLCHRCTMRLVSK